MRTLLTIFLFCLLGLFPARAQKDRFPSVDFKMKTAVLEGRITNYRADSFPKSGIIYLGDVVTDNRFPRAVPIGPDGTFSCRLPLSYPVCAYLILDKGALPFYLEPGGRLRMTFDFDPSRRFNWGGRINYEGDEAQTARQLNDYPATLFGEREIRYGLDHFQPLEMRDYMMEQLRTAVARVDSLRRTVPLTGKAARLMEYESRLRAGGVLFDYVKRMLDSSLDKKGHREKIPAEYYSFLREMPLDDPFALAAMSYSGLINDLEFSFVGYYTNEIGRVVVKKDTAKAARVRRYIAKTDSFLRVNGGVDVPATLMGRILRVHSAHWMLRELPDTTVARRLCDTLLPATAEPYLRQVLEKRYAEVCLPPVYAPRELADGPGADIIRRIIAPYRGRYVLVDFWGTTCSPCRQAIERSAEMRMACKDGPDVVFVYLTGTTDSPSEQAYADYVEKHLAGWPSHRLPQDEYNYLCELFRIHGIPHYAVFDRKGRLLSDDYHLDYIGVGFESDLRKWKRAEQEERE